MTHVTVEQLVPGDHIQLPTPVGEMIAVFIGQGPHPGYSTLRAVTWYFPDGHFLSPDMLFSIDALDPKQEVGELVRRDRPPITRVNDLAYMLNLLKKKDN